MKKVFCLIYSDDGFDLDVLHNHIDLCKKNGFNYLFSNRIFPCDLLIVLRISNVINLLNQLPNSRISNILNVDYSGQKNLDFHLICKKEYPAINIITLTSSKNVSSCDSVYFSHPYVSINRWVCKKNDLRHDKILHIGNFKIKSKEDPYLGNFLNFVLNNLYHFVVYGRDWPLLQLGGYRAFRGPVHLKRVSSIYAQHSIAIGIKHPFQRKRAISGRYWHATLNGCHLIVEDSYEADRIPGLKLLDYNNLNLDTIKELQSSLIAPEILKVQAKEFWETNNSKIEKLLSSLLVEKKNKLNSLLFIRIRLANFIYLNTKDFKWTLISKANYLRHILKGIFLFILSLGVFSLF